MNWMKLFIESLEQWDQATPNKTLKLNDVATYLTVTIGGELSLSEKETGLNDLKERITYLVKYEAVNESFLIDSLLNFTMEYFRNFNTKRSERIINEENAVKEYEIQGEEVPGSTYERIERLKSNDDIVAWEHALSNWEVIIANNFSLVNRRMLYSKEFQDQCEKSMESSASLSEDDKDKPHVKQGEKVKN